MTNVTISQSELNELIALRKQDELRKAKAVLASQKSRELRMSKMTEEELQLYRAKNALASRKSNAKKRNEIAELRNRLAQYEMNEQ